MKDYLMKSCITQVILENFIVKTVDVKYLMAQLSAYLVGIKKKVKTFQKEKN